eukprot:6524-Heterococcus_DN1.PRE.1
MLTGAQMTRMPDDISRGRADFKVYMDQLLQHSNSTWAREAPGEAGTTVGGVQLPPAGVMHEEERAPLTTAWDVQSSKDNSANTFSESELVAQVSKPRAGVTTRTAVPYPRNFAWSETAAVSNGRTGIAAKSHADEPVEGDENVDWKKVWADRYNKGSLHTDYQLHYKWPSKEAYTAATAAAPAAATTTAATIAPTATVPEPTAAAAAAAAQDNSNNNEFGDHRSA